MARCQVELSDLDVTTEYRLTSSLLSPLLTRDTRGFSWLQREEVDVFLMDSWTECFKRKLFEIQQITYFLFPVTSLKMRIRDEII